MRDMDFANDPLNCASCDRVIRCESMIQHFEQFHAGPRPVEILQLDCFDCYFRVSVDNLPFMINHCLSEGHQYDGVSEWRKFIEMEGERIGRLIKLGIRTLKQDQPSVVRSSPSVSHRMNRQSFSYSQPEEGDKSGDSSSEYGEERSFQMPRLEYSGSRFQEEEGMAKRRQDRFNNSVSIKLEKLTSKSQKNPEEITKSAGIVSKNGEVSERIKKPEVAQVKSRKRKNVKDFVVDPLTGEKPPEAPQEMERVFKASITSSDFRQMARQDTLDSTILDGSLFVDDSQNPEPVMSYVKGNSILIKQGENMTPIVSKDPDHFNFSTPRPKRPTENRWDQLPILSPSGARHPSDRVAVKEEVDAPFPSEDQVNVSIINTSISSGTKRPRLRKLSCLLCGQLCPADTFISLFRHLTVHEDRLRKYECVTCTKRYDARFAADAHVRFSRDSDRTCEGFRLIHLDHAIQLQLVEKVLAEAFPSEKVPEAYITLRPKKKKRSPAERRETCQFCKRNVKCSSTVSAIGHAIRHDKSLGWLECKSCGQKFDSNSSIQRHASSKHNDCQGDYNELVGPEMVEKIQAMVDHCFPEKKWDVKQMRQFRQTSHKSNN